MPGIGLLVLNPNEVVGREAFVSREFNELGTRVFMDVCGS